MKNFVKGFFISGIISILTGLIGLGGTEFRLTLLKTNFKFEIFKLIILNKVTSLLVVIFALFFRTNEIPLEVLFENKIIILNILIGTLVGTWISVDYVKSINKDLLKDIVFVFLLFIPVILIYKHYFLDTTNINIIENYYTKFLIGILAGFIIGIFTSLLGFLGGEFLIPTIVILYGVDIKLAGSLSLVISIPTITVGLIRYSKHQSLIVLKEEKKLFIALIVGSIIGTIIGALLLGVVSVNIIILILVTILLIFAYKIHYL